MSTDSQKLKKLLRICSFTEEELQILKELDFEVTEEAEAEYYYNSYFQVQLVKDLDPSDELYRSKNSILFETEPSEFYFHINVVDKDNRHRNFGGCYRGNNLRALIPFLQAQIKYVTGR